MIKSSSTLIVILMTFTIINSSCKDAIDTGFYKESFSSDNPELNVLEVSLPPIVLGTYNIRTDTPADAPDHKWSDRKSLVIDMIKTYKFDVFGIQEAKSNQMADMTSLLPEFGKIGVDRNADGTGEYTAIFYKKEKFSIISSGNFWLSSTPDAPGSIGWDAAYPRVCTWAKIKDINTGTSFFYFNTHLDLRPQAQIQSVNLLLTKIGQIAGTNPVVLSADFNFDQYSVKYNTLNNSGKFKDAYTLNNYPYNPKGHTYNGYDISLVSDKRIDHIFVSAHFQVDQFGILSDTYNGNLPSDHYPTRILLNPASQPDQPAVVSIPYGQTINIKGSNNKFVSSNNGTANMKCDRTTTGSWENFSISNAGTGKVYLKAVNMYVSSEDGNMPMTCSRITPGGWERFNWIPNADGTFSLRGSNGRYVSSGNGTYDMTCTSVEVRGWEKFSFL